MAAALMVLLAVGATGCRSAPSEQKAAQMRLSLDPKGGIVIRNRTVQLQDLPAELRRAGAGPGTTIVISIPQETPKETATNIIKTLWAAGFNRVLLTKPRQVSAYAADKQSPASNPAAGTGR